MAPPRGRWRVRPPFPTSSVCLLVAVVAVVLVLVSVLVVVLGQGLVGLGAVARLVVGLVVLSTAVVLAVGVWELESGLLGGEEAWLRT